MRGDRPPPATPERIAEWAAPLNEAGIFYDPEGVTPGELAALCDYAEAHGQTLLTREQFVDEVFFARAFQFRATIVGFNLPFDLSRLAISYGTARAPIDGEQGMRDAFTFKLSGQKIWPNVRVKHMSRTAAQISFCRSDEADGGARTAQAERYRAGQTRAFHRRENARKRPVCSLF
jgi:hypothetical protein